MLEHARSVKNKENKTALAEHAITNKHSFDFKNTKILDFENNLKRRLILEMIHIQKENSSINYKTDIENLSAIYYNIIKCIKKWFFYFYFILTSVYYNIKKILKKKNNFLF